MDNFTDFRQQLELLAASYRSHELFYVYIHVNITYKFHYTDR